MANTEEPPEPLQGELFPLFRPQKSVELKKDFALNFGGLEKIEKIYKPLLANKLTSGLTLQQHIDKVRRWFNSLKGEDLGKWIKLFAYVKAVRDYSEGAEEIINFRELSPGRYCFSIKQNKDFFMYFIRPDKKSGQFTTKAKTKFLKWLHDNQSTIEFPMIINGKVWNIPMRIYEYAESVSVSDKEIRFIVDTNILESEFRDYVSINVDEINAIQEAWETAADQNTDFTKNRLHNYSDIPLKFLLTLKNIYNREGGFKIKTDRGGLIGNTQRLSRESMDAHLCNLSDRLKEHMEKSQRIRTGKHGKLLGEMENLIYETTFKIAIDRGWLFSMPGYENGLYKFNINPGYFDRARTAKRLKALKNP